jgi:hypothetical protein
MRSAVGLAFDQGQQFRHSNNAESDKPLTLLGVVTSA